MSENEETATALDRIRGWREEYRLGLAPSPLEDVTQLSAQLDLTHAHPSGIAQLFAGAAPRVPGGVAGGARRPAARGGRGRAGGGLAGG